MNGRGVGTWSVVQNCIAHVIGDALVHGPEQVSHLGGLRTGGEASVWARESQPTQLLDSAPRPPQFTEWGVRGGGGFPARALHASVGAVKISKGLVLVLGSARRVEPLAAN